MIAGHRAAKELESSERDIDSASFTLSATAAVAARSAVAVSAGLAGAAWRTDGTAACRTTGAGAAVAPRATSATVAARGGVVGDDWLVEKGLLVAGVQSPAQGIAARTAVAGITAAAGAATVATIATVADEA